MRLNDFSGIIIPDNSAADTILSSHRSNLVTMRAGVIDQDGGMTYPEVQQFGRQGWYISDIDRSIDDLRRRASLGAGVLRAKMRDNTVRVTLAKCTQVVTNADVNNYECWQPFTVRFQQTYPYWLDERDGEFLDSGFTLDSGHVLDGAVQSFNISSNPLNFTVLNNGNAVVPMMFIHVACGATASINTVKLTNNTNGMTLHYNGTVGNNQRLIIDTLGRNVYLDYSAIYDGFGLDDEKQTNWMQLQQGNNNFTLTYNTKTNTPTIEFYFVRHYV